MCWAWLYVHSLNELCQGLRILTSEMRNMAAGPNFTASKELRVQSRPLNFSTQNPVLGTTCHMALLFVYLFMVVSQTGNMDPDVVQLAQIIVGI